MEIFGIGAAELFFIFLIAIIILGPKDMQKAGRAIGRWLNNLVRSDSWKVFQRTSAEIRNLPRNLMREANMELEEANKALKEASEKANEELQQAGKELQKIDQDVQKLDRDVQQSIEPRPVAPPARGYPLNSPPPRDARGETPVQENKASELPFDQADTAPEPPAVPSTETDNETKQND